MTTALPPVTDASYQALDAWIDAHFDDEVAYLQALVQVPTDTPPGHNAPPSCWPASACTLKNIRCPPPMCRPMACKA